MASSEFSTVYPTGRTVAANAVRDWFYYVGMVILSDDDLVAMRRVMGGDGDGFVETRGVDDDGIRLLYRQYLLNLCKNIVFHGGQWYGLWSLIFTNGDVNDITEMINNKNPAEIYARVYDRGREDAS